METSIDLYADEYAADYDDVDNENAENVNQEEQTENENQEEPLEAENNDNEADGNKEEDDEEKKKVKPKRVIKNPRPKLNIDTLKSHKGLLCLESYFKNKKYKGRGHEEEDLRSIMKTYEYWCHRLFPKYHFNDCLQSLEKLGAKKNVQTYLKRIRMDLVFDDEQPVTNDTVNEDSIEVEESNDPFDTLLPHEHVDQMPTLTEEQLERIKLNREKANQLRLEKLQREKDKVQSGLSQDTISDLIENNVVENIDIAENQEDTPIQSSTQDTISNLIQNDFVKNIDITENQEGALIHSLMQDAANESVQNNVVENLDAVENDLLINNLTEAEVTKLVQNSLVETTDRVENHGDTPINNTKLQEKSNDSVMFFSASDVEPTETISQEMDVDDDREIV